MNIKDRDGAVEESRMTYCWILFLRSQSTIPKSLKVAYNFDWPSARGNNVPSSIGLAINWILDMFSFQCSSPLS